MAATDVDGFYDWLTVGLQKHWVSEIYCETHEGAPMCDSEVGDFEDGLDPCIFSIRVYEDDDDAG